MRLVDDLAARRILYGRPLATMPDVLLIDIPSVYASPSLPLGHYYPIILETGAEGAEMQAFLEQDRPQPVAPDIFDRPPSALRGDDVMFARYKPPLPDWPWLLLCRWPDDCVALVTPGGDHFARGVYSTEVFATVAEIERAEAQLMATLGAGAPVYISAQPDVLGHA